MRLLQPTVNNESHPRKLLGKSKRSDVRLEPRAAGIGSQAGKQFSAWMRIIAVNTYAGRSGCCHDFRHHFAVHQTITTLRVSCGSHPDL